MGLISLGQAPIHHHLHTFQKAPRVCRRADLVSRNIFLIRKDRQGCGIDPESWSLVSFRNFRAEPPRAGRADCKEERCPWPGPLSSRGFPGPRESCWFHGLLAAKLHMWRPALGGHVLSGRRDARLQVTPEESWALPASLGREPGLSSPCFLSTKRASVTVYCSCE